MSATNWSRTPEESGVADPLIAANDGASSRELARSIRATMAGVRKLADDQGGALKSSGTGNTYDVRTFSGLTEARAGIVLSFVPHRANDGPSSLVVDGLGAMPLLDRDGANLSTGALKPGRLVRVVFDAEGEAWRAADLALVGNSDLAEAPPGTFKGNDCSGVADIPTASARVLLNVDRLPNKTEEEMVADGAIAAALAEKATNAEVSTISEELATKATSDDISTLIAPIAARTDSAESSIDALNDQLAAVPASQGGGFIGAKSWADLVTRTSTVVGALAEVPETDTGTHTDPVTGALNTPNSGIFAWSATPPGWGRLRPNEIAALKAEVFRVEQLAEGIATLDTVYAKTFSDESLRVLIGFRKDGAVDIADGYLTLDPVWRYVKTYSDETTVMYGMRRDGTFYPGGSSAVADLPTWITKSAEVTVNKAGRRADLTLGMPSTMTNFGASATSDLATYSQDNGSSVQAVTEDLTCLTSLLLGTTALFHDLVYGQSLGNGTNSGPITHGEIIAPGRAVMFNSGYKPHGVSAAVAIPYANIMSLVDARENGDQQSPAAGISFGMVQPGRLGSTEASAVSVHARGGQKYAVLKKNGSEGGAEYNNFIRSLRRMKVIAQINGILYLSPAVHWIQGEADIDQTLVIYSANMIEFQHDVSADVGQPVVVIMDQTSSCTAYNRTTSEVPLAQLAVALANPLTHACVGPKYFLTYSDGIHLVADSYNRLGCYHARTRDRMRKGLDARPMHVISVTRISATIFRLKFYVPAGELTIDTTTVSDPGNYGVSWNQTGGTARTITSVAKVSATEVDVTLSGDPGSFAPTSHIGIALYGVAGNDAGRTTGARSCFRDQSTDLDIDGNPMPNWACHQKLLVTA